MNRWDALKTVIEVYTKRNGSYCPKMGPQNLLALMYLAEAFSGSDMTIDGIERIYKVEHEIANDKVMEIVKEHEKNNPPPKLKWWQKLAR